MEEQIGHVMEMHQPSLGYSTCLCRTSLPADTPLGPAEIVVVVAPQAARVEPTLGDLLHCEFFGMWREREDSIDGVEFARRLRSEGWSRTP